MPRSIELIQAEIRSCQNEISQLENNKATMEADARMRGLTGPAS